MCFSTAFVNGTNMRIRLSNDVDGQNGPDEDRELVVLCKKGRTDAFEKLVRKYQKKILNTAFRITGEYEEACDIVQDAFMSAYRNIKDFRQESGFLTWLTAITINLSANRVRKLRSIRSHETVSIIGGGDKNGVTGIDPQSEGPSAVELVEREEESRRIQECLDRLGPEFREVIVLRDMQEFSYEEIGGMLKLPEGTVKSRLSRARGAMGDCLKNRLGDYHGTP